MRLLVTACITVLCICCNRYAFQSKWTTEKAPASYVVRFETTKGTFDVKVTREWSPLAADRFYQLVKHKFYDSAIFYRVLPNGLAQFAAKDYVESQKWKQHKIEDEPVIHSNKKGTLSFARIGKDSRGDAAFINLKDNNHLDTLNYEGVKGFPAFGDVIAGIEVVSSLYSGHGNKPVPENTLRYTDRDEFFKKFPGLDVIKKAYILKN